MDKKRNSSRQKGLSDKRQLTQTIIDEMKAQGFLDGFIDEETGKALLEIQFADEKFICQVGNVGNDSSQE